MKKPQKIIPLERKNYQKIAYQKMLHIRQIQIERHIQLHIQDRIMITNQKRTYPVTATV